MDDQRWIATVNQWLRGELGEQELLAWHNEALKAVVDHVQRSSPFYNTHLGSISASEVSLDNIAALPFTTKDDLRSAMFDMLCGEVADADFYFETTGTTGAPTPCPKSWLDFELNYLPIAQMLRNVADKHFTAGEKPVLAVLIPNEVHAACTTFAFAARHAGIAKLDVFPISPTVGFQRCFEVLLDLRVNMVLCSPGLLMALAEMSESYGIDVRADLNIQCLLTTGEMCSTAMQESLAQTYDAAVYNVLYGSQEAGVPAVTDISGALTKVEPTYLFEVLDVDSGESLGFEGRGELCLTCLVPGIKPLIRYRTGDLVAVTRHHGETPRTTLEVFGRVKDRVMIAGQYRSAVEIENAIMIDATAIYGYDLDITADEGAVDRLTIRLKAKDHADHDQLKRRVRQHVLTALGVAADVTVLPLLNLKSATGGWVSWKSARINDQRRTPQVDDIEERWSNDLALAAEERI